MLHNISLLILRNSFASFVQPDPSKQRSENLHIHKVQGGSNITGTDVARFTHKSVPVIFEPPCTTYEQSSVGCYRDGNRLVSN